MPRVKLVLGVSRADCAATYKVIWLLSAFGRGCMKVHEVTFGESFAADLFAQCFNISVAA